jgi:hypothetical protein
MWCPFDNAWGFKTDKWDVKLPIETTANIGRIGCTSHERELLSIWGFVFRSLGIMLRVYSSYRAMKIFATAGIVTASLGSLLGLRFLYIYFFIPTTRDLHIQSLILAAILLLAGFQMILTGIVADLINSSRAIIEDVSYRIRHLELKQSIEDSVIIPRQSIEKTIHGDSATSITET